MINMSIFQGRLIKDPEITASNDGKKIAKFAIVVQRPTKKPDGTYDGDLVFLTAWEARAELAEKYLKKGQEVNVVARYRSGSYDDKNGNKVYTQEFVVQEIHFISTPKDAQSALEKPTAAKPPVRQTQPSYPNRTKTKPEYSFNTEEDPEEVPF